MQRYVTDLRSITQGRGVFGLDLSSYETVPNHLTEQLVAASQREAEEK
jgi:elongation factor G